MEMTEKKSVRCLLAKNNSLLWLLLSWTPPKKGKLLPDPRATSTKLSMAILIKLQLLHNPIPPALTSLYFRLHHSRLRFLDLSSSRSILSYCRVNHYYSSSHRSVVSTAFKNSGMRSPRFSSRCFSIFPM